MLFLYIGYQLLYPIEIEHILNRRNSKIDYHCLLIILLIVSGLISERKAHNSKVTSIEVI